MAYFLWRTMFAICYRREQGGMATLSEKSHQEASKGRGDPQILAKNRPDAAYAIAMALCKHIPLLINRDDIQNLVGEYKRRIGKLIFDSYQVLVEAVKIWNNEEKRQEVCHYIKETAGQYPNHRGMKKKLMGLMPETPFEGEPMAVTREPNDMEKSLL